MKPNWPKTPEDRLLDAYWRTRDTGHLYTEVKLAKDHWAERPWTGSARERRLDGVLVDGSMDGPRGHGGFAKAVETLRDHGCDLIEVKAGLSEPVLGQAVVGRWLFEQQVTASYGLRVNRNIVLTRHVDPAMAWVAKRLGVDVEVPLPPKSPVFTRSRPRYALRDARLQRLALWRGEEPTGLVLTRIPIAGPDADVPDWHQPAAESGLPDEPAAQTWIDYLHIPSQPAGPGLVVFGPEHRHLLEKAPRLELIYVGRHLLGRGPFGICAAHALMFERQYRRGIDACRIICGQPDPAITAACTALPGPLGLPEFVVRSVGSVGIDDVPDTDEPGTT